MTHEEMIAVIRAHMDGKSIEFRRTDGSYPQEWTLCDDVKWSFGVCDYRVKPEPSKPKIRPYANKEEFLEDQQIHGPHIYACGQYHLPTLIDDDCIVTVSVSGALAHKYGSLVGVYSWQDKTPCGVITE